MAIVARNREQYPSREANRANGQVLPENRSLLNQIDFANTNERVSHFYGTRMGMSSKG
jgi:hypothetical protein